MIHFIQGKPGGGKSLYALMQIIEELRTSERWVVTNLDLKLPELNEYLCQEFGENPGDGAWTDRIRLIDDVTTKTFWLYEGPGREHRNKTIITDDKNFREEYPDFSDRSGKGVLYVLDEIHIHFSAREWQKTSKHAIFYCSQHRKLRDDVLLVTQHPEQVDKNFRRLAQDFTTLRNMGNETVMGFRFTNRFRRATYQAEKRPNDRQPAMNTGWFKLDTKIANCYDTNAGVGIVGRTDVNEKRAKGMSPWWIPVIIVAILALLWYTPKLLRTGFFTAVDTMLDEKKEIVQSTVGDQVQLAPQMTPQPKPVAPPKTATTPSPIAKPIPDKPKLKSIVVVGLERHYYLDNGEVLTLDHPKVGKTGEYFVIHHDYGYLSK